MCPDLLAKSLPSISKDPRITSVAPASTASPLGFWEQWHYQHHWIASYVTNSSDKNMSADAFLSPGSVSPHSCSMLLLLGGWSTVSVLFGFIFVSITCSSMKNDQQVFAAPSHLLCYLRSTLCTWPLGRLHIPLFPGWAWLSHLIDFLWKSLQSWLGSKFFLFVLMLICTSCPFSSSLPFGCTSPIFCFGAELPALQFTFYSIT